MQYLWQHKLQLRPGMKTVDGRALQVIDPGRLNADSGPDFFNARVDIDGERWAGNVEIHMRATDWYRHHHDNDPAYDSVILHVVGVNDRDVTVPRCGGRVIPQVEMPCPRHLVDRYEALLSASRASLPCATVLRGMTSLQVADLLGTLGMERLQDKADRVQSLLAALGGDWEEVAYIILARALGFSVNSDQFERLARATPLRYIRKHADDPMLIEAMLMGQAGLLPDTADGNNYVRRLVADYRFLANKFGLSAPAISWKTSRMRPANMPHRRIALLARILTSSRSLLSHIISVKSYDDAASIFNRELDGYWRTSYSFSTPAPGAAPAPSALGRASVTSLIINVVAPLTYAWAMSRGDDRLADRATELLQQSPAEHNRLTVFVEDAGVVLHNALESQAAIQLRRAYCEPSKCLYCKVGYRAMLNG